MRENLRSKK